MLAYTNYIVILAYLILILGLGFSFRKINKTSSDFLRAGGTLPWFWVGASAYVSQFSAWSFTTGAAEAFNNKYNILITFWANAVSFIIAGLYFADKFRQLKVNNAAGAIKLRFGKVNSVLFSIVNVPTFLIYPAFWLSGLSVFIGAAFNIPVRNTIVIIGIITLIMSIMGGAWAIVSSDFIQTIIITIVSLACAIVAINKFRDIGGLFEALPIKDNFEPSSSNSFLLYFMWAFYMFVQKAVGTNNFNNLSRFNSVDSSKSAKKAAFFTAAIYILGTSIWFVPPWFISTQYSSLAELFPALNRPDQAAYLIFVQQYMPVGVLGIVVVALFAATMSSLDSSLNWCTGYILAHIKEEAQNKKLKVLYGKLLTLCFGIIIIITALYLDTLWHVSFFDLTYTLIGYLYLPLIIAIFLSIWIKKTPDWGFAFSIIIGLLLSVVLSSNKEFWKILLDRWFSISEPSSKDITHITLFGNLVMQFIVTGGVFVLSSLFYNPKRIPKYRLHDVEEFYNRLGSPVHADEAHQRSIAHNFNRINLIAGISAIVLLEVLFLNSKPLLLYSIGTLTILLSFIFYKKMKNKLV